jgi:hypothetical protein
MNWLRSALLVFFLIGGLAGHAKELPPGAGGATESPVNILVAFDLSSSMNHNVPGPTAPKEPRDIAVDSKGNWHIEHQAVWGGSPGPISRFSKEREYEKSYGFPFSRNSYEMPKLAVDTADNLYVTDRVNSQVHKFNSAGTHQKTFAVPFPLGIDVDPTGNIYVSGSDESYKPPWTLRKIDPTGVLIKEWEIGNESGDYPYGVSVYDGRVYVVSRSGKNGALTHSVPSGCNVGYLVRIYSASSGALIDSWYALGGQDIEVTAKGVYVLKQREIYRTEPDYCGGQVGSYSYAGDFQTRFSPYGPFEDNPPDRMLWHYGLGSDVGGNIYVVGGRYEQYSRALKFDPDGKLLTGLYSRRTRLDAMKGVLKSLLERPDMNDNIHWGLLGWSWDARMFVKISPEGAKKIIELSCKYCSTSFDYLFAFGPGRSGTNLKSGIELAERYYKGAAAGFTPSPIDPKIPCQKSIILVLSDGESFSGHELPAVKRLVDSMGIETGVVGFALAPYANQEAYINVAKAGNTFPYTPQFSENEGELAGAIELIVSKARQSKLVYTGTSPTISSDAAGDFIYQSTFTIPETGQWRGKLTKYELDAATGKVGNVIWEAGAKLNATSPDSRKVWTVSPWVTMAMNNFVASDSRQLMWALYEGAGFYPEESEIKKLINFVRGIDAYDENKDLNTADEREWKLGDIYHSEMAIVGPPKAIDTELAGDTNTEEYLKLQNGYQAFIDANASRETMVYVGANDGMLHAFKDSTGEELWGFIPPNVLPKLRSMFSGVEHVTIPIYGVDGSPVVKDVLLGGQWRTVLMAGLGREGYGYFALDVTNPSVPKFMFAFLNDSKEKAVYYWDEAGTKSKHYHRSVPPDMNYSMMGEALSTPTIIAIEVNSGEPQKWVAVIGGGLNNTDDKDYGSVLYVINIEDQGRVLRVFDLPDESGGFKNSHPSPVTAVTADTTSAASYKGARLYAADLESRLYNVNQCNVGSASPCVGASTHDQDMLTGDAGNEVNQRASFNAVTPAIDSNNKLWVYFGTGNLDKLQLSQATIQNRIFGVKDSSFPIVTKGGGVGMSSPTIKNVTGAGATCPSESDDGWYLNLERDEKVVAKIALDKGVLYAPVYKPDTAQLCFPGVSTLYQMGYACGKVLKQTALGTGLVAGVRAYKDKVYVSISGTPANQTEVDLADGFTKKGSIISGEIATPSASNSQKAVIESWREKF